jgi:hypothetical protein
LEDRNGFSIGSFSERCVDQIFQILDMSRFPLVQELKILFVVFENVADTELDVGFSTLHIIVEVREGQLRLNHPKFSNVPAGVRNFSSEGRAESVDIAQRAAKVFNSKLS